MTQTALNELARGAVDGDRTALNALLAHIQHPVYRLALRFLGHPQDAEDATQEILIRVTTRLGTFEGRSEFMTWVYSIAIRMLSRTRKRLIESSVRGAEPFARLLDEGLAARDFTADDAEYRMLCEEIRISCTYGMLLCLSRPLRAAYILGDVLGLTDVVGASICEITPAAFRARLSRARRTIRTVIDNRCGLVDPANPCRCSRQIESGLRLGMVDRDKPTFAPLRRQRADAPDLQPAANQLDVLLDIADLYRADRFAAPETVWQHLRQACPDLIDGSPGAHVVDPDQVTVAAQDATPSVASRR